MLLTLSVVLSSKEGGVGEEEIKTNFSACIVKKESDGGAHSDEFSARPSHGSEKNGKSYPDQFLLAKTSPRRNKLFQILRRVPKCDLPRELVASAAGKNAANGLAFRE